MEWHQTAVIGAYDFLTRAAMAVDDGRWADPVQDSGDFVMAI